MRAYASALALVFVSSFGTSALAAEPVLYDETKFRPADGQPGDVFGADVALDGDRALIGALGVDEAAPVAGAAYLLERRASTYNQWDQVKKLLPSSPLVGLSFGGAVALDGEVAVVGADGRAYVFERDAGGPNAWGEVKVVSGVTDRFGDAVAVDGDTVVVGDLVDFTAASSAGAIFIYQRDEGGAGNWGLVKQILASDAMDGDHFGAALALDQDTLAVGAFGVDGVELGEGAVYVLERDAGGADNWGEVKKVVLSSPGEFAQFGRRVDVDGSSLVVGTTNFGGPPFGKGGAWVFERDLGGADNWGLVKQLLPIGEAGVGSDVAIQGDVVVVGADLAAFEPLPTQRSGAIYRFERNEGGPENWGNSLRLTPFDGGDSRELGRAIALDGDTILSTGRVQGPYPDSDFLYSFVPRAVHTFVTDADYAPDFGGIAGGDARCAAEAEAAGWAGVWRALLSVPGTSGSSRVATGLPIQRVDRAPLVPDALGLTGPIANPLGLEAGGGTAAAGTHVWTGDVGVAGHCADFSATGSEIGGYGLTSETSSAWLDAGDESCTNQNRLYCFEVRCPEAPAPTCLGGFGKGVLSVRETKNGSEKLSIKATKGPALTQADFGNPLVAGGTPYTACVYDDAGARVLELEVDRAGELCEGKSCWKSTGGSPPSGNGFLYKDKGLASDGVQLLSLKAGAAGKSKFSLKAANKFGKGLDNLPSGIGWALFGSTSVTVQLHAGAADPCLSLSLDEVVRDFGTIFLAKAS